MVTFSLLAVTGCLLMRYITAYTPAPRHYGSITDGNAMGAHSVSHPQTPVDIHHQATPDTHQSSANANTNVPSSLFSSIFPFLWILNGQQEFTTKQLAESLQLPVVQFMNVHRNKVVKGPFIEVQQSIDAYAGDQQRAFLHFKVANDVHEGRVQVTGANLVLKRVQTGDDYGMLCPTKSIKISRVLPPNNDGKEEPHVIGNRVTADTTSERVTSDISSLLNESAGPINPRDFWLMIESDPQCYYTFDPTPGQSSISINIMKTIKVPVPNNRMALSPFIIFGIVGVGGMLYMIRKNRTDYTYFQDHENLVADA